MTFASIQYFIWTHQGFATIDAALEDFTCKRRTPFLLVLLISFHFYFNSFNLSRQYYGSVTLGRQQRWIAEQKENYILSFQTTSVCTVSLLHDKIFSRKQKETEHEHENSAVSEKDFEAAWGNLLIRGRSPLSDHAQGSEGCYLWTSWMNSKLGAVDISCCCKKFLPNRTINQRPVRIVILLAH